MTHISLPGHFPPYAGKFTKMNPGEVKENLRRWVVENPQDNPDTNRPTKRLKEYRARVNGYIRNQNVVYQSNDKIVFAGCGAATVSVLPWSVHSRPADFHMWVVEPQFRKPLFFPSKIYDIFYNHSEETYLSTPTKLKEFIYPDGYGDAYWHRHAITFIDPVERYFISTDNVKIPYEILVLSTGAHSYFEEIEGLSSTLGENGVSSLYYEGEDFHHFRFKRDLADFRGGRILFYTPHTKMYHASTSASLVNLTHEKLKQRRISDFQIHHFSPIPYSTGDSFIDAKIREQWTKKGIKWDDDSKLLAVDSNRKLAVFENSKKEIRMEKFDILHVTPPMAAIPAIRNCPSLCDSEGWLKVCPYTFTNHEFPNIFGWGSGTNLPVPRSFFSSYAQVECAMTTLNYFFTCLTWRKLQWAASRKKFYDGSGYDVVHLGNRRTYVIRHKNGLLDHYAHFPHVYESWDIQKTLKDYIEHFVEMSHLPYFQSPEMIHTHMYRTYPLEPSAESGDEWHHI